VADNLGPAAALSRGPATNPSVPSDLERFRRIRRRSSSSRGECSNRRLNSSIAS